MNVLIKKELRLSRRFLLIWLGLVTLTCFFSYFEYLSLKDTMDELVGLIDDFPEVLKIMFGCTGDLSTTMGWFGCIYFWIAILDYSYAVYLGITCVSKEVKQGTAEYLFTRPVARPVMIWAKALSCLVNLFILASVSGLINYLTGALPLGGLESNSILLTTTLGLFLTEAILYSLALLIAAGVSDYHRAVRLGAFMLLTFYGIYVLADLYHIFTLYILTPLKYFDVFEVGEHGLSLSSVLLSLALVLFCITGAEKLWSRREILS